MTTSLRVALRLAILAIALTPQNSFAQDSDERWVRKSLRSSCQWWETCRHRYYRKPRHIEIRNVYRREREFDSYRNLDRCKPALRVWGSQAQSIENAKGKALEALAGATRFQYGEIYLDFSMAEDVKVLCGPSSVADTLTSKFQEKVLSTEYYRCEIQAKPCRPKRKED